VTPPDLPEWALIAILEPSPHDPAVAYLAATRYKLDDFTPYLYKTRDYGQSWTRITDGIPADDFTRVIREDPVRRGLLYAGTETGLYVSVDDGGHWERFQTNLPVVPVHDLVVKDADLVVATHGRGFWILDDVTPLRQLTDAVRQAEVHLFPPRPTIRFMTDRGFGASEIPGKNYQMTGATMVTLEVTKRPDGEVERRLVDAGENPPDGAIVYYFFKERPKGDVTLTFLDADGREIRTFSSKREAPEPSAPAEPSVAGEALEAPAEQAATTVEPEEEKEPKVPKEAGLNRFVWNLRYPDATKVAGYASMGLSVVGPQVPPGRYQVRLSVGDTTLTEWFEVRKDPRVPASDADLQAQFDLLKKIHAKLDETHKAVNRIRGIREQVEQWERRASGRPGAEAVAEAAKALKDRLAAVEEQLIQVKAKSRQDTLNYPMMLNDKLASVARAVASADAAPTRQAYEAYEDVSGRIDVQLAALGQALEQELPAFERAVREANVPLVDPEAQPSTPADGKAR
ncbi:MAG: glycosyl hydrolase, partial [Thermomicrobiaceae bacterium]|nr:glycosyl hydrolase [Thermomicrobiaceae bacterium]